MTKYESIANLVRNTENDEELINKLISVIALNDYEQGDQFISTILDMSVEYADTPTTKERKDKLKKRYLQCLTSFCNYIFKFDDKSTYIIFC